MLWGTIEAFFELISSEIVAGTPVMFVSTYLIGSKGQATLEDDEGRKWRVEWISYMQSGRRLKFTVGWPEFACAQNIQEGDLLILQVVSPIHFKLHIIPLGGKL